MKGRLSGRNFEDHWGADLDDLDKEIIKRPLLAERPREFLLWSKGYLTGQIRRKDGRSQAFHPRFWICLIDTPGMVAAAPLRRV